MYNWDGVRDTHNAYTIVSDATSLFGSQVCDFLLMMPIFLAAPIKLLNRNKEPSYIIRSITG